MITNSINSCILKDSIIKGIEWNESTDFIPVDSETMKEVILIVISIYTDITVIPCEYEDKELASKDWLELTKIVIGIELENNPQKTESSPGVTCLRCNNLIEIPYDIYMYDSIGPYCNHCYDIKRTK